VLPVRLTPEAFEYFSQNNSWKRWSSKSISRSPETWWRVVIEKCHDEMEKHQNRQKIW